MSESNCIYYTEKFPNAQFTELEFKQARIEELLPFKCEYCGKVFYRSKRAAYNNNPKFCSVACSKLNKVQDKWCEGSCLVCGVTVNKLKKEYEKHPTFLCSKSCSATYKNLHRDSSVYTKAKKSLANTLIQKKTSFKPQNKTSSDTIKKAKERNIRQYHSSYVCKVCGAVGHTCKYPEICKSHLWYKGTSLFDLGVDKALLGTEQIYDSLNELKIKITNASQHDKNIFKAILQLNEGKQFLSLKTVQRIAKVLGFPIEEYKTKPRCGKRKIIHQTWFGEEINLISDNEHQYACVLDSLKWMYQYEQLRIPYFDTIRNRIVVSKPDFYIPEKNLIVEVKSHYTYKYQVMVDRMNEFHRLGYNFKLVLDYVEYDDECPYLEHPTIFDAA